MGRSYNKLWKLMIDQGLNKTELRLKTNVSSNAIAKLGRDESVPLITLEKICRVLNCSLEDIIEINIEKKGEGK